MSIIKAEDIRGYHVDGGLTVCSECATSDEAANAKQEELILTDEIDRLNNDLYYYCDRCGEPL